MCPSLSANEGAVSAAIHPQSRNCRVVAQTEWLESLEFTVSMLNLPKKIACMIAGAGCLMLVNGGIALADDVRQLPQREGQIEALERIGACSRAIEGGLVW
jgi:N-dimethylarginine dimethylaminohydrolase